MALGSIQDPKVTQATGSPVGGFSIGPLETILTTIHLSPVSAQLLHPPGSGGSASTGCIFLSAAFSFRRYIDHQERCIPKQGAPLQGPMPSHIHFGCVSEFSSWGSDREPFALTTLSQRNHSQKQKGGKNVTLKRKVNPPTYSHMDS